MALMIIFLASFTTKLHALKIIYYSLDHCLTLMALTCVFPMNEEDTVCKIKIKGFLLLTELFYCKEKLNFSKAMLF